MSAWMVEARTLGSLSYDELVRHLLAHSGLPGPRGNLELGDAVADVADRATILRLADASEEYLRFCGTQSLGRLVAESPDEALLGLLEERAQDPLWRVREAVARALQRVGDDDPALLQRIVRDWVHGSSPRLARAAVAGICEPRLLTSPAMRSAALDACRCATATILAVPPEDRRRDDVRNLRKALGYCWSVAIAADPDHGMAAFRAVQDDPDPDAQWIAASNLSKQRLRRLLPSPTIEESSR